MKLKLSEIFEIILAVVLIIALILKNAHIPYMSLLFLLSAGILATLYFYGGFFLFKSPGIKPVYTVIYGLIFSLAMIALIFKSQKWPFSRMYLAISIICLLILAFARIISVYLIRNKEILQYNKGIAIRYGVLLISMLCLIFY